jgi:hypothetical protein
VILEFGSFSFILKIALDRKTSSCLGEKFVTRMKPKLLISKANEIEQNGMKLFVPFS